MIGNSFKVFLKSLKYILIPIASLLLFGGIGFLVVYLMAKGDFSSAKGEIEAVIGEFDANISDMFAFINDSLNELSVNNFQIFELISNGWFVDKGMEFVAKYTAITDAYSDEVKQVLMSYSSNFTSYIWIFTVFIIVGAGLGYFVTGFLIKKQNFEKSIFRTILVLILDLAITAGVAWLIAFISAKWQWAQGVYVTVAIGLLFYFMVELILAYVAENDGSMSFLDVVNPKNMILLFLAYLVIIAIAILCCYLFNLIPIKIITLGLIYSTLLITIIDISILAEAYVATQK